MTGAVVEVDVPAGSKDGDTFTLEALGLPGFGGAPPGNLNLTMEIIPAPRLEAE